MAVRTFALALTLGAFAVACGRSEARSPDVVTSPVPPKVQPADPPPAIPPALVEQANAAPPPAEPMITPAAATPVAAGDDLQDPTQANVAEVQAEARANAQAVAKEKAKWAKLAVQQDRKQTEDWSRERAMKAGARASTLQSQVSRVPPAKKGRFNTDMTAFVTKKNDVLSRCASLTATGSEEWKTAKAQLDRAIDEMDNALNRLEGDF